MLPAACHRYIGWLPLSCLPAGIEKWGIVEANGTRIYAYEVDGMGNTLVRCWCQLAATNSEEPLVLPGLPLPSKHLNQPPSALQPAFVASASSRRCKTIQSTEDTIAAPLPLPPPLLPPVCSLTLTMPMCPACCPSRCWATATTPQSTMPPGNAS